MSMRRPYQITGTIFLLFSAFIAYESLQLRYYTPLGPGPGFFSFWLSLIFGGLAIIMIVQASVGRAETMPEDFFSDRIGYLRIGAVVLSLVFTTVLFEILGFRLAMLIVYVFLLQALGRQGIVITAIVSLFGSFGVFHVFDQWLKVPLPRGVFGL
jgi:putative tricarboxylic transport membrane protein